MTIPYTFFFAVRKLHLILAREIAFGIRGTAVDIIK